MDAGASPTVTQLLVSWNNGDRAALQQLMPVVYAELKRLARRHLARERGHTLQPTALIHEAYIKLIQINRVDWRDRAHFLAMAATVMRRVLVDMARTRGRDKRGGGQVHVSLSEAEQQPAAQRADLMALDEAMKALELVDARKSQVVELRYFGGLSLEEAALVLNVSVATVRRDWSFARAWLFRELSRA